MLADGYVEDKYSRDANKKVFVKGDIEKFIIYLNPIHELVNGVWEEIDVSFKSAISKYKSSQKFDVTSNTKDRVVTVNENEILLSVDGKSIITSTLLDFSNVEVNTGAITTRSETQKQIEKIIPVQNGYVIQSILSEDSLLIKKEINTTEGTRLVSSEGIIYLLNSNDEIIARITASQLTDGNNQIYASMAKMSYTQISATSYIVEAKIPSSSLSGLIAPYTVDLSVSVNTYSNVQLYGIRSGQTFFDKSYAHTDTAVIGNADYNQGYILGCGSEFNILPCKSPMNYGLVYFYNGSAFSDVIGENREVVSANLKLYTMTNSKAVDGNKKIDYGTYMLDPSNPFSLSMISWEKYQQYIASSNAPVKFGNTVSIGGGGLQEHLFDITGILQSWENSGTHHGIVIKEENNPSYAHYFMNHNYSVSSYHPSIVITTQKKSPVPDDLPLSDTTLNLRPFVQSKRQEGILYFGALGFDGIARPDSVVSAVVVKKEDNSEIHADFSFVDDGHRRYPMYKAPGYALIEKAQIYYRLVSNYQMPTLMYNQGQLDNDTLYQARVRTLDGFDDTNWVDGDTFQLHQVTAYDRLERIVAYYGITDIELFMQDNNMADNVLIEGNLLFIRNPQKNAGKPYIYEPLTTDDKKAIDHDLMGRNVGCVYGYEPINFNTGNFFYSNSDFAYSEFDLVYALERNYNSQAYYIDSSFGYGWSNSLVPQLFFLKSGNIELEDGTGRMVTFILNSDGTYQTPYGTTYSIDKVKIGTGSRLVDSDYYDQDDAPKQTLESYDIYEYVVKSLDSKVLRFNEGGQITSVIHNQFNHETKYEYENYRLVKIISHGGKEYTLTYNDAGYISSINAPDSTKVHYEYDETGNLVKYIDQSGYAINYKYNDNHQMISYTSREDGSLIIENSYDDSGRVTKQLNADGITVEFSYASNLTTISDSVGNSETVETTERGYTKSHNGNPIIYDSKGRVVSKTGKNGVVTTYTYTASGYIETETVDGKVKTYEYDGSGNVVSTTDFNGDITILEYHSFNQITKTIYPNGSTIESSYNADGQLTYKKSVSGYQAWYDYTDTMLTKERDSLGNSKSFTYTSIGQRSSFTDELGNTTYYKYDPRGLLIEIQTPEYTTMKTYNGDGELVVEVDGNGNITTTEYDNWSKVVKVCRVNGCIGYEYDDRGNRTKVIDELGYVTETVYNELDQVVEIINANNVSSYYFYDDKGRTIKSVDFSGKESTKDYDEDGRVVSETVNGLTTSYIYEDGVLVEKVLPTGHSEYYFYEDNKLKRITTSFNDETIYTYVGELLVSTTVNGVTTTKEYDHLNRLVKETDALGNVTKTKYFANGLISEVILANGTKTIFHYDKSNRLIAEENALGEITRYTLDGNGNKIEVIDANGNKSTTDYNAANLPIRRVTAEGIIYLYEYDERYNLISETIQDSYGSSSRSFTYTKLNELESETDQLGRVTTYKYNNAGQVIEKDASGKVTTYEYNDQGFISIETTPTLVTKYIYDDYGRKIETSNSLNEVTKNTYNDRGQLTKKENQHGLVETYKYDSNKNLEEYIDIRGNKTLYEYDLLGQVTKVTHPTGEEDTTVYNGIGQIISTTVSGVTTNYSFDLAGRVIATEIVGLSTSTITYDKVGNKKTETNSLGATTLYDYDKDNRVIRVTDALGGVVETEYDRNSSPLSVKVNNTRITQFKYDELGREVLVIDALGFGTEKKYDEYNNVIEVIDGEGNKTSYKYNEADQVIETKDTLGNITKTIYNDLYQVVTTISPNGNQTHYTYNEFNLVESTTQPNGLQTTNKYNKYGDLVELYQTGVNKPISAYTYDKYGRQTSVVDILGNKTETIYDSLSRVTSIKYPNGLETATVYDGYGRVTKDIDIRGLVTEMTYDSENQIILSMDNRGNHYTFDYDLLGRKVSQSDGVISELFVFNDFGELEKEVLSTGAAKEYIYDLKGQLVESIDEEGYSTKQRYDGLGNVVESIDALGNVKQFEYDGNNRLVATKEVDNQVVRYEYDKEGNQTRVTFEKDIVREFKYNNMNQLIEVRDIDSTLETYKYDIYGKKVEEDHVGNRVEYTYNELLQLDSKVSKYETIGYKYDAYGRLTETSSKAGTSVISYDVYDQIIISKDTNGNVIEYKYDIYGNQLQIVYPDGKVVTNEFNSLDQLTKVISDTTIVYTYNEHNQLVKVEASNGVTTTYEYDLKGNFSKQSLVKGAVLLSETVTVRDGLDNIINEESLVDGERSSKVYTYDNKDQLQTSSITTTKGDGSVEIEEIVNEYDKQGNRVRTITTTNGQIVVEAYWMNKESQLLRIERSDGLDTRYAYDEAGRMISKDTGKDKEEYVYNQENQLIEIISNDKSVRYEYDGLGNRVSKTTEVPYTYEYDVEVKAEEVKPTGDTLTDQLERIKNQFTVSSKYPTCQTTLTGESSRVVTEEYSNDITRDNVEVLSIETSAKTTNYTYGYGRIGKESNKEVIYYLTNSYNDVVGEMKDSGEVESYKYGLYGQQTSDKTEFGYRSEYHEGNLQYLRARYYDTESGRFITKDSYLGQQGSSVSQNRYTYTLNNPIKYVDKNGHSAQKGGSATIVTGGSLRGLKTSDTSTSQKTEGNLRSRGLAGDVAKIKQMTAEKIAKKAEEDISKQLENIYNYYGDYPSLQQYIAEYIAKYCADRNLDPMEILNLEKVKESVSKYITIDEAIESAYIDGYNSIVNERTQNEQITKYQGQKLENIVTKLIGNGQFSSGYEYCDYVFIDKVMEDYVRCGSTLSPYDYYAQVVKNKYGIDVNVDARPEFNKLMQSGLEKLGDVTVGNIYYGAKTMIEAFSADNFWDGAKQFVSGAGQLLFGLGTTVAVMFMPFLAAKEGALANVIMSELGAEFAFTQYLSGGMTALESVPDIMNGDYDEAGKKILEGGVDIVSALTVLKVSGLFDKVSPELINEVGVLLGAESVGASIQSYIGDITNDDRYREDGNMHILGVIIKAYLVGNAQNKYNKGTGKVSDDLKFGSDTKSSTKLNNQMNQRGWSEQSVKYTVDNPYTTRTSTNLATNNPATVYYTKEGAYVIVDNITKEVVQISDAINPATWIPDSNIIDPFLP